ncbi:hypothetical protein N7470_005162 [Penicillium chermesinum]|nr:hypothetical protein N7470_005162 [Penicillium chermesinum]
MKQKNSLGRYKRSEFWQRRARPTAQDRDQQGECQKSDKDNDAQDAEEKQEVKLEAQDDFNKRPPEV